MWSTWGETAKASLQQALEKTGDALDKAGESLTKVAVSAGKSARAAEEHHDGDSGGAGTEDAAAAGSAAAAAASGATIALPNKQQELLKNFQTGWTSVVQTTRQSIVKAQEAVEETQHKMQERMRKARTSLAKRDPSLPLDVPALKDAQVVYVTDRLISMGHPALDSSVDGKITGERKLAAVGHLLQRRHDGRYMVWNISEVDYDVSILDEQVLNYSFPGSPSPPLGLLLKLLVSIESWLKADARNVAVVHCLTGKGRTSTVLAAFLCWMGEAQFDNIHQALDYIAQCKQISTDELTIPSQRRYVSYFKNMLDGVRPSQPPLKLKRIIMSQAPNYTRRSPASLVAQEETANAAATASSQGDAGDGDKKDGTSTPPTSTTTTTAKPVEEAQLLGCVPYMQIFKAGKLVHTAPASLHFQQSPQDLPFCCLADGSISFHIDQVVQGDVLIRCRHLTLKKQRISMFRAAFHTGYVPPNVMRITKAQLDGACSDDRFPDDFYLDVIFEPVDSEEASKIMEQNKIDAEDPDHHHHHDGAAASATGDGDGASPPATTTVTASAYDTMLHRDSRFWDVIAKRKELHAKEAQEATAEKQTTDPFWGPTVGRRREFKKQQSNETSSSGSSAAGAGGGKAAFTPAAGNSAGLETFSIGNEFDFLPSTEEPKPAVTTGPALKAAAKASLKPKRDSLMEALMGALNDDDEKIHETEAIIFDYHDKPEDTISDSAAAAATVKEPAPTIVQLPPAAGMTAATAASDGGPSEAQSATPTISATTAQASEKDEKPAAETTPAAATAAAAAPATAPEKALSRSDVDALLASSGDDDDDDDEDMDGLLADAGVGGDDVDLDDLDDAELEDLENFLTK